MLEKHSPSMEQHHYPLKLMTEASIDLANDAELLEIVFRANFRSVFIGIETPRVESLKETRKFQNIPGRHPGSKAEANPGRRPGHPRPDFSSVLTMTTKASLKTSSVLSRTMGSLSQWLGCCRQYQRTPLYDRLQREGRLFK